MYVAVDALLKLQVEMAVTRAAGVFSKFATGKHPLLSGIFKITHLLLLLLKVLSFNFCRFNLLFVEFVLDGSI